MIASYARAGDVMTGSFALPRPAPQEERKEEGLK